MGVAPRVADPVGYLSSLLLSTGSRRDRRVSESGMLSARPEPKVGRSGRILDGFQTELRSAGT